MDAMQLNIYNNAKQMDKEKNINQALDEYYRDEEKSQKMVQMDINRQKESLQRRLAERKKSRDFTRSVNY